ncbi:MAG: ABC transporter substrate-binding protein, partial [Schaalia sp.]
MATSFTGVEAERFNASVADFSRCTGVTIVQNGSDELENQLRAELGGSATDLADIAVVPQPGLVTDLARHGRIVPLPEAVGANTELGWDRIWSDAGRVDGELYGAPLMASLKSFIWYSPVAFERAGYEVPTTWDELVELTDRVAADHPDGSVAPWCLGAADGATTGWPVSDWLEDGLLAIHGTGAYDQWASHDVPVDAPVAVSTLDSLDSLLLAKGHVAGGRAGAVSMTMEEAGAELVSGACLMLHASSSFETVLPPGTTVTDADGAHGVTVSASPTEAASAPGGQPGDGSQPT